MSDTDIKRFTQLVRESIGLKDDRGDQINVINQSFKTNAPLRPVDGLPLWQTALAHCQLAKQIVGAGLVLVVAFLVLRPLMKSLTKSLRPRSRRGGDGRRSGRRSCQPFRTGRQGDQAAPSFEQQIAAAQNLGGAGSEACRTGREGLGRRGWLTSRTNSPERSAPPSCS